MKKILLILTILAPFAEILAQEPAPKIAVKESIFNFGERDNTTSVEHVFEIFNEGDAVLEITNTKTSCGCTVADLSRKSIPPGESATLKAVFNLKNKRGQQRKSITVESNDPNTPQIQLMLEGTASSFLTINPERIFLSGISSDAEITRTVDITSKDKPMVIKGIQNPLHQVDASLETIREGFQYRVNIKTRPPLDIGRFQGNLIIETEPAGQPYISVLVMGDVAGAIAFAPQEIVFHQESSSAVTRYIVVRPGSQKTFTITKVELPNEEMETKTFPMGQNGYRLQLMNIIPSADLNGQKIIIHTDSEIMPVLEIPFAVKKGKPSA